MARRQFDVIDVVEILQHWYAGRSKAEVATSVGVDRGTVRKYVAPAEAEGLVPGGPPIDRAGWIRRVEGWFPELVDARVRSLTFGEINAHRQRISDWLDGEVTVSTVHQRLRDEHGLEAGLTSVRRYVWLEFADRDVNPDRVTVPRPPVEPGSEAQVDYGYLGQWLDPITGRLRKVWAFVMVLACSRHMFVRPVLRMDQTAWVAAHVAAFEFFAGVPARLVPDNLATGVTKPDLYDPKLNRAYADLAGHYDCLIDPARAGKPKDKPRVERPMSYIRSSFWRGRSFDSLEQMQTAAAGWCINVAGQRAHRGLDGAAPLAVFSALEAPALKGLPRDVFELAVWSRPKVASDCHVKVGRALYSVPWKLIGQLLPVRITENELIIYNNDVREVARHLLFHGISGQERIEKSHRPPVEHEQQAEQLRQRFAELGEVATRFLEGLLKKQRYGKRQAQRVLGLLSAYQRADVLAAMERAVKYHAYSLSSLERILSAQATPKPSWQSLSESDQETLKRLAEDKPIQPRPSEAYQHLLFDENTDDDQKEDHQKDCDESDRPDDSRKDSRSPDDAQDSGDERTSG